MTRAHSHTHRPRLIRERRHLATLLPLPCHRCGQPVTPDMRWDVDHDPPLSLDPAAARAYPAHTSCNRSHGATLGNRTRSRTPDPVFCDPGHTAPRNDLVHTRRVSAGHSPETAGAGPEMHEDGWVLPRIASDPRPGTSYDLADELLAWVDANAPGEPLSGWQRWAWRRMWETADGRLWPVVLLLMSRQQGKTYLVRRALLARAMRGGAVFGQRQTVLNVAPSYALAEDLMEPWAREMVDRGHGRFLARHSNYADWWVDGQVSGSQWLVRAMRESALRGVAGVTCAFVDEVQSTPYRVRRSLRPTMSGSRLRNTQMVLAGTGALAGAEHMVTHEQSRLLRELRQQAMSGGDVLLLEWSAPEDADPEDERAWAWASPDWSPERLEFLRSEAGGAAFSSEYLVRHQDLDDAAGLPGEPLVDAGTWAGCRVPGLRPGSLAEVGCAAVEDDFGRGGAVALAWRDAHGSPCVWAGAMPLERCWEQVAGAGSVLCGLSLRDSPGAVGVGARGVGAKEITAALAVVRSLVGTGELRWDGDGRLAAEGSAARVGLGSQSVMTLKPGQELTVLRAALFAVGELVNRVVEAPAVF